MDFISILSIFVLACFVGYFVVWSVTPALHTPLMAVTNAISSVIIVGALIAAAAVQSTPVNDVGRAAVSDANTAPKQGVGYSDVYSKPTLEKLSESSSAGTTRFMSEPQTPWAKWLGLLAVVLASVNIFGGFAVTARMLAMYKKKERP